MVVLVRSGYFNKLLCSPSDLNNNHLFVTVLEDGESKAKVLAAAASAEDLPSGL